MTKTTTSLVALIIASGAAATVACGKGPEDKKAEWSCHAADVPMGEVVRCSRAALTSDGPAGGTTDGTGGTGGTTDGTGGTTDGTGGGVWPPGGVLGDLPGGTLGGTNPNDPTNGGATGGGSTSDGTVPGGTILGTVDRDNTWTPYFCPAGSLNPDCPPIEATNPTGGLGSGGTSDGTTPGGGAATSGGTTSGGTTSGGTTSGGTTSGGTTPGGGGTSDGTAPGGGGGSNGGGGGVGGGGTGPGGGSSSSKGPDECGYVPDLPYCPGSPGGGTSDGTVPGGASSSGGSSSGGGSSGSLPPGQEKKNGGTGDGTTGDGTTGNGSSGNASSSGSSGGGKGHDHNCKKDKKGNVACESVPACPPGNKPSKCGACVPEGETGDCVPQSAGGCWVTGGGFIDTNDGKDNFGGNAKPMKDGRIQGNWNHVDHGPAHHHGQGKPAYIVCRKVDEPGPGQPGGKKGFVMNQVYFGGPAKWDHVEGYWFDVVAKDHGEPGSVPHVKNGFMVDTYHYTMRLMSDPVNQVSGAIVYEVRGGLVGGNIQLHPPNGGHPYTPMSLPAWVSYEP